MQQPEGQGGKKGRGRGGRGRGQRPAQPQPPGQQQPPPPQQQPPPPQQQPQPQQWPQPAQQQPQPQQWPRPAQQQPPQQQPQPQQWPRPAQQQPPPQQWPQVPPQEAEVGVGVGARAVRRGTSRPVDARPGEPEVEELGRQLEGAAIAEGAVGPAGEGQPAAAAGPVQWRSRYSDFRFRREGLEDTRGSSGRGITVRGCYFNLTTPDTWRIYQYHVDFLPPCESKKMKKGLLYNHGDLIGPVRAFDGMILFLPHRLPADETVVYSNRRADNANIKITIKYTCELLNVNPATLQVLNVIWRKILSLMNLTEISRHYFDTKNPIDVTQHKLQVLSGFQSSILRYEHNVMLDIDVAHKILRTETVLDHLYRLQRMYQGRNYDHYCSHASRELVGAIVMTRYNHKTYTVDDIEWNGSVTGTFLKNDNPVRYIDYYQAQYNIEILDTQQPLLVSRAKKRDLRAGQPPNIYLVPELCIVTGLNDENRADYNLMNDLSAHTRLNPATRAARLKRFRGNLDQNEQVVAELNNWNLQLDDNLISIPARQLNIETLTMLDRGNRVSLNYKQEEADWSRDMRGKTMLNAATLNNWVVIVPSRSAAKGRELADFLRRVGPPMGMRIGAPNIKEIANDRNDSYMEALRTCVTAGTDIVVCVLPNSRKDRYDAIKKFCCINEPVPSQLVLDKTLSNKGRLMSVATKIAIQMNCKMGGDVWSAAIPLKGTMIVGFDSYHDSSKKGSSVGGVVATINPEYTQYYSTTTFQTSHMELLNQLGSCIAACVRAFKDVSKCHPKNVIVFRDGVGDGMLDMVYQHEIPQVKAAIGANTKLGFVVVKKRTSARFFQESGGGRSAGGRGDSQRRGGGGAGAAHDSGFINPGPGTVIDDVVTKHDWFDFYLISQSVRQGTVTPTHYNVILDEILMQPDHYQRLSYKLCHMYYNWQGTIRVPAPCMYAHKLAFLVGQSLHKAPSEQLSRNLYYL